MALLGTMFLKPIKSPKKRMDLQPKKVLKCNSYVPYRLRQIIAATSSSPQCKGCVLDDVYNFQAVIYFFIL